MRSKIASALAVALLATLAGADEDAPWLDEVSTEADRAMLAGLLDPDEERRKSAAKLWERERLAFVETHGFPGWPRDEMDPEKPRHAFEARKAKLTNGFVRALKEGPPLVRRAACRSIADLRPAFMHGRDALGKAIDDEDPRVRAAAIEALVLLRPTEGGRNVEAWTPAIVGRLLDDDLAARRAAIDAVGYLLHGKGNRGLAHMALGKLVQSTTADDAAVRGAAYGAAARIAPREAWTATILSRGLDDEQAEVRTVAAWGLANAASRETTDPARTCASRLRELLKDDEFDVRWAAANALWETTEDAKGIVPVCAEALGRLEGLELAPVCRLICRIGPDASPTAPALVAILGGIPHVRHMATGSEAHHALLSVGPELEDVREAIAKRLSSDDPKDRGEAIRALRAVHASPDAFAELLLGRLGSEEDERVRAMVLYALARRAPARAQMFAAELCEEAREAEEHFERLIRLRVLAQIGSPEAVACVGEFLADPKDAPHAFLELRQAGGRAAGALDAVMAYAEVEPVGACQLLATMGQAVAPVLPKLETMLSAVPDDAVPDLAEAIRCGGGEAGPSVARLVPLLASSDELSRERAARALGAWGNAAKSALPALEQLRDRADAFDDDGDAAAVAAARVGGSREMAIERCLYHLRHSTPPDEGAIREMLPIIGPEESEAIPDLLEAALYWRKEFHKQDARTLVALEALGCIGPPAKEALPVIRSLGRNVLFHEAAEEVIRRIDAE